MEQGYVSEIFVSFQGEGARVGERHLFVRMAACNLRCRYCDTPGSLVRTPYLTIWRAGWPPSRLPNPVHHVQLRRHAAAFLESEGPIDAIAVTGGEPLLQADYLAPFLREARFPVPVLLETNGSLPQQLAAVLPWVSVISMDIKPPSNTGERPLWREHEEFLSAASGTETYVKVLVDRSTSEEDVLRASQMAADHGPLPLFLQPITDTDGRPDIDASTLGRLFARARQVHPTVRVLPQIHKLLGIQ